VLELAIACAVSAAAWAYLLLAHGGYWLTGQRLPAARATAAPAFPGAGGQAMPNVPGPDWPAVVAVIPARNEAAILPVTLPGLLGQDYPGEFRVILVDDGSDDGTGDVAVGIGQARHGGAPLTVLRGRARPDGWAGKVWAMSQGLEAAGPEPLAGGAAGDGYVLFTDADIAWRQGALRRLVAAAEGDSRDLVSQMALLRAQAFWEKAVVPAFVYFFAQLYPFRRVNSPASRTAAGAGGCMLIRRSSLAKAGGLEPIRGALIDDVALAAMLKRGGSRCWLGLTTEITSARPYPRLADLWHMVARSAYTQLRYSPALLAGTLTGLLLLYAAPPAGAIAGLAAAAGGGTAAGAGAALAGFAGLAGWLMMTVTYLPMLAFYRLSPLRAPALPLIALLYAAMTADSARRHYTGRAVPWRGRATARA
jgi:hopene-associated glycosyltransferase HpnB